jgi:hypothetical protein
VCDSLLSRNLTRAPLSTTSNLNLALLLRRMGAPEWLVAKTAVVSRAVVLGIAVITAQVASPFDASNVPAAQPDTLLDRAVQGSLRPLANWDGVFFEAVSNQGYTHEQFHAFFPLLPGISRALARFVLAPLCAALGLPISLDSTILVSIIIVSNVTHVLAAVLLLWLTRVVFQVSPDGSAASKAEACARERMSITSALLFAITPAGVFASAAYTESLFAALTFAGLLQLEFARSAVAQGRGFVFWVLHLGVASVFLALAGATRSNGVTAVGFVLFAAAEAAANALGLGSLAPAAVSTNAAVRRSSSAWSVWSEWLWNNHRDAQAGLLLSTKTATPSIIPASPSSHVRSRGNRHGAEGTLAPLDLGEAALGEAEAPRKPSSSSWVPESLSSHFFDWFCPCVGLHRRTAGVMSWFLAMEPAPVLSAKSPAMHPASHNLAAPTVSQRVEAWLYSLTGVAASAAIAVPMVLFSWWGYSLYCTGAPPSGKPWETLASLVGASLPAHGATQRRPWCDKPFGVGIYSFVQEEYWNVGLFNYWTLAQLPNFLLAGPMLFASACGVLWYFRGRIGRTIAAVGGLVASAAGVAVESALGGGVTVPAGADEWYDRMPLDKPALDKAGEEEPTEVDDVSSAKKPARVIHRTDSSRKLRRSSTPGDTPQDAPQDTVTWQLSAMYLTPRALPYVVQWGLLGALAIFGMHVQVATRFLAACPPVHWWLASLWLWPVREDRELYRWWITAWLVGYTAIGCVLFPLFYPWT